MSPSVTVCGSDLLSGVPGPWLSLADTSNGDTDESGQSIWGGGLSVDSTVSISGASNRDTANSRFESPLLFLARAPGPSPFEITVLFGNVYARAEGRTRDEWGFSSHYIWWDAHVRVSALVPQRTLVGQTQLTWFGNRDWAGKSGWMRRRMNDTDFLETKLGVRDWDHDDCCFMRHVSYPFAPSRPMEEGDILGFEVALRVNHTAVADDVSLSSRARVLADIASVTITSSEEAAS